MEENGKPLVPDEAPPPKTRAGKLASLDPDEVCEVIYESKGFLNHVLDKLHISYESLRRLRKKYPNVERAYQRSRKLDRPEVIRDRLMEAAKYDDKVACWLAERICKELKPVPKQVQVGVGQNPGAGPIQHQHMVGVINIVPIWDKLPLEARRLLIELARSQGVNQIQGVSLPTVIEHQSEPEKVKLDDVSDCG